MNIEAILQRAREICAGGADADDIVVCVDTLPDETDEGYWVDARVFVRKSDLAEEDDSEDEFCDCCGATVTNLIGCPSGAEVCQSCFDEGQT